MYRCPICNEPLSRAEKIYQCPNRHCYDISKRGYVNLLPPKSSVPGDNKEMVLARRDFLNAGFYAPFSEAVNHMIFHAADERNRDSSTLNLLDAGCGEGYYTSRFPAQSVWGADISKEAVDHACRRSVQAAKASYCVASVFHLPYCNAVFDGAVSLFAPICAPELNRVLKEDGFVIVGAPAKEHLMELKAAIYDETYENDEIPPEISGFTLAKVDKIRYNMNITDSSMITALFSMTPYAFHTPKEGIARLQALTSLDITANFAIYLYKRN